MSSRPAAGIPRDPDGDPDGDGCGNEWERRSHTDPLDPLVHPQWPMIFILR